LAAAEEHVASGAAKIERQKDIVARLGHDGHDIRIARALLVELEKIQEHAVIDRERLARDLKERELRQASEE
jgi:hypothetical protein